MAPNNVQVSLGMAVHQRFACNGDWKISAIPSTRCTKGTKTQQKLNFPIYFFPPQAPESRDINVEAVSSDIRGLWGGLVAGIDAYSPPENPSRGRKHCHDHACITLEIVKVALANFGIKFGIDEAEFLSSKMDSDPDFAGFAWFTPAKTIRNRTKAIRRYNSYHDPKLSEPAPVPRNSGRRSNPSGHTWDSADLRHPRWAEHRDILAKSLVAIEACTLKEIGKIFNGQEMGCKAVVLWNKISPDEFKKYMEEKKKEKKEKKKENERSRAQEADDVVAALDTVTPIEATTRPRKRRRNTTTTNNNNNNNTPDNSLTGNSLYGYYRFQAHGVDMPRYTYAERNNNAHVSQNVPAAVEAVQVTGEEPEELWQPEEDEQQHISLFPDEFCMSDTLTFEDILRADMVLDNY
jgi:hypothetical protein